MRAKEGVRFGTAAAVSCLFAAAAVPCLFAAVIWCMLFAAAAASAPGSGVTLVMGRIGSTTLHTM